MGDGIRGREERGFRGEERTSGERGWCGVVWRVGEGQVVWRSVWAVSACCLPVVCLPPWTSSNGARDGRKGKRRRKGRGGRGAVRRLAGFVLYAVSHVSASGPGGSTAYGVLQSGVASEISHSQRSDGWLGLGRVPLSPSEARLVPWCRACEALRCDAARGWWRGGRLPRMTDETALLTAVRPMRGVDGAGT